MVSSRSLSIGSPFSFTRNSFSPPPSIRQPMSYFREVTIWESCFMGVVELVLVPRELPRVEVRIEGHHLAVERTEDDGEDRRRDAVGVVDDQLELLPVDRLDVERGEELLLVGFGGPLGEGDRADIFAGRTGEILAEEEPLDALGLLSMGGPCRWRRRK